MQCTNFERIIDALRYVAYDELQAAVTAHGGRYTWPDKSTAPMICCYVRDEMSRFEVSEISVVDGSLKIKGWDGAGEPDTEINAYILSPECIETLICEIPETEAVDDVRASSIRLSISKINKPQKTK